MPLLLIVESKVISRSLNFLSSLFRGKGDDDRPTENDISQQKKIQDSSTNERVWPLPESWKAFETYIDIHPTAVIDASSTLNIPLLPIGPHCCLKIGAGSHIFGKFHLQKSNARIIIGDRCHIGSSTFIATKEINIADDVIVSWGCVFADGSNHSLHWSERCKDVTIFREEYLEHKGHAVGRYHDWSNVPVEKITIGPKVWISFNCIILKGVSIHEEAVIGAGAVVTRSVPPCTFAAGNPARPRKKLFMSESACESPGFSNGSIS